MEFPLWAAFGLTSATLSAVMMLVQEHLKIHGFALAFWNKVACVCFMLPLALYMGLPDGWMFYALIAAQAVLWAISDVVFFTAIPKVGAGVVSRILPLSVIVTFCLWFVIDPALFHTYLQTPIISALIVLTLCGSVYFSMRLRHCPISWQALRLIWFVLFAAVVGPIFMKIVTQHADIQTGPFSYVVCEALAMVAMWLLWYAWRKPVAANILWAWPSVRAGFIIGAVSSFMVATNFAAYFYVDNPGLIPAVKFMDTVIILAAYRVMGRREEADVTSGLGIVACAALLILLKA